MISISFELKQINYDCKAGTTHINEKANDFSPQQGHI